MIFFFFFFGLPLGPLAFSQVYPRFAQGPLGPWGALVGPWLNLETYLSQPCIGSTYG